MPFLLNPSLMCFLPSITHKQFSRSELDKRKGFFIDSRKLWICPWVCYALYHSLLLPQLQQQQPSANNFKSAFEFSNHKSALNNLFFPLKPLNLKENIQALYTMTCSFHTFFLWSYSNLRQPMKKSVKVPFNSLFHWQSGNKLELVRDLYNLWKETFCKTLPQPLVWGKQRLISLLTAVDNILESANTRT